jgi:hypothetical protein
MKIVTVESHAKSIYIYTYRAAKKVWTVNIACLESINKWVENCIGLGALKDFLPFSVKIHKEYTVSHLYFCIHIFYLLFQYLIFFGRIISSSL